MSQKTLLQAYQNKLTKTVPFWLMRQAGRYLPEYRALRAEAGGFLDMVYHPERASEITMQPIRRFSMHGAILFADILLVPQALGQDLKFVTGEGPKLDALQSAEDIDNLSTENIDQTLSPIYETVQFVRQKLQTENFEDTALIGFAGAPWTVACYMVEGGGSKDFAKVKAMAENHSEMFQKLIDTITTATIHYLEKQVEAGVEALQIFDSWAGLLDEKSFHQWVIKPTQKIVKALNQSHPEISIVGFPRAAGNNYTAYAEQTGVNVIGVDQYQSPDWIVENLQGNAAVQGNLDPEALLEGGDRLKREALEILDKLADKPFIFNLGHGVIKETPPEHVEILTKLIRDYR